MEEKVNVIELTEELCSELEACGCGCSKSSGMKEGA